MDNNNNTGAATGLVYPMTKMNFLVTVDGISGTAAFTEVTGVEGTVDVIEFRQGNSASLAPMKIPGLVKHGNVTLKFGYLPGNAIKDWVLDCVAEQRKSSLARHDVKIEMIEIYEAGSPTAPPTGGAGKIWILQNAFVTKYSGADLDAKSSDVAIESIEIAYEQLTIPN